MPRPRPQNITIQLPPRPGARPRPASATSECTPNITGFGWKHYSEPRWALNAGEDPEDPYVLVESVEPPVESSADITIELVDGVLPEESDGYYEFAFIGETCGCAPVWDVTYQIDDDPGSGGTFEILAAGSTLVLYAIGSVTLGLGVYSIAATCGGITGGPILLTLSGTGE